MTLIEGWILLIDKDTEILVLPWLDTMFEFFRWFIVNYKYMISISFRLEMRLSLRETESDCLLMLTG